MNDFHKWEAWSPWAKLDPNSKVSFEGPQAGEGTAMAWAGNGEVGVGKMTLIESRANELVKIKTDFTEPFEGTSSAQFVFKPEGGKTAVTWSMDADQSFIERAVCLIMNGKKRVGDQMEQGLAKLKQVSESQS